MCAVHSFSAISKISCIFRCIVVCFCHTQNSVEPRKASIYTYTLSMCVCIQKFVNKIVHNIFIHPVCSIDTELHKHFDFQSISVRQYSCYSRFPVRALIQFRLGWHVWNFCCYRNENNTIRLCIHNITILTVDNKYAHWNSVCCGVNIGKTLRMCA